MNLFAEDFSLHPLKYLKYHHRLNYSFARSKQKLASHFILTDIALAFQIYK